MGDTGVLFIDKAIGDILVFPVGLDRVLSISVSIDVPEPITGSGMSPSSGDGFYTFAGIEAEIPNELSIELEANSFKGIQVWWEDEFQYALPCYSMTDNEVLKMFDNLVDKAMESIDTSSREALAKTTRRFIEDSIKELGMKLLM